MQFNDTNDILHSCGKRNDITYRKIPLQINKKEYWFEIQTESGLFDLECFKFGQYSYLPAKMEQLKSYFRLDMPELMQDYCEFLNGFFKKRKNYNLIFNSKAHTIIFKNKTVSIDRYFKKFLEQKYANYLDDLIEINGKRLYLK